MAALKSGHCHFWPQAPAQVPVQEELTLFVGRGLTPMWLLETQRNHSIAQDIGQKHSRSKESGMSRFATLTRNPAMIALVAALAITGCASKKNNLPNNAGDLGLNGAGNAAPGSAQDFTVNVGDRIFFDTDSSVVRADAQATLDRQSQWLAQYPNYAITIEGHADERGTREYNIALGARRAAATRDYLASRGVPAQRMKTISYGKERPVAVCDDISCWSQNRRAVTALGGAGS
jgi:peptidoglycan-associated lipoprotein